MMDNYSLMAEHLDLKVVSVNKDKSQTKNIYHTTRIKLIFRWFRYEIHLVKEFIVENK